jgi:spore coat protein U-like protein
MKCSSALNFTARAAVLGLLALGLSTTSAFAASPATTTFAVTANVATNCAVSATALGFGSYTGAVNTASSTVTVTCTNSTGYTVGLDAGLTGASVTTRQMKNGAATLNYGLFSNGTWATNWGNTLATNWVIGTGNGAAQALTVYGQIAAGQYVTPGSYSDTITATVTY